MSKRWAAWPRGIRWLAGGIAAVVLALAIVWALFVPVADWLAHHDVGSVKGPLHETALDNARGRLLTLGAGLFAAGALVFTARNFTLSRRTFELTEQGQVTDRYTKAIEQLGSDKLDVRIGGIYALERIARDSARDHPTVMEVLTAFIREHSREPWPEPDPGSQEQERSTRPDVQAAVSSGQIVRRIGATPPDCKPPSPRDLIRADLTGADLSGATSTRPHRREPRRREPLPREPHRRGPLRRGPLRRGPLRRDPHRRGPLPRGPLPRGPHRRGPLSAQREPHRREPHRREPHRREPRRRDPHRRDLSDADLTGADLAGANLTGATLPARIGQTIRLQAAWLYGD